MCFSAITTKDGEVIKELKALSKELKALKKEVKDVSADLVSFARTSWRRLLLMLNYSFLRDNLRNISEGAFALVGAKKEGFAA